MKINKPELVCPAGDWASLRTAVKNGADSVYFGIKGLNMRNLATNFDVLELKKIIGFLHAHKKRGYLALNVIVMHNEADKIKTILKTAKAASVDAVIAWDACVISIAKKLNLRIHLSTQTSVANIEAVKFFTKLGAKRIVLARECTLKDIKQIITAIKKGKLRCEIETFIHGAMCVSISGRCFLSQYSFNKSANRGECLQPCRREFLIKDTEGETDYLLGKDYLLSPKDLCAIEFIDELIKAGITAFKIEGRMRSPEYIKVATSVYRKAIDSHFKGKLSGPLKKKLKQQLKTVYTRGFSSGFYFGQPTNAFSRKLAHTHEKVFLGEVKKFYKRIGVAEILLQNSSLKKGDEIIFYSKNTPVETATVQEMQQKHKFIKQAKKGEIIGVKLPFMVKSKDKVFIWRLK